LKEPPNPQSVFHLPMTTCLQSGEKKKEKTVIGGGKNGGKKVLSETKSTPSPSYLYSSFHGTGTVLLAKKTGKGEENKRGKKGRGGSGGVGSRINIIHRIKLHVFFFQTFSKPQLFGGGGGKDM